MKKKPRRIFPKITYPRIISRILIEFEDDISDEELKDIEDTFTGRKGGLGLLMMRRPFPDDKPPTTVYTFKRI